MIIHFSTVHPRDDSRIRDKELASLKERFGGPVAFYVQDGKGPEIDARANFPIVDTGPPLRRMSRMSRGGWRMFQAVRRAKPRVAHFHDPELLPWAMLLSLFGIKLVYDIHEDVPQQVLHNHHIPRWARRPVSLLAAAVEKVSALFLSGYAAATPVIADRFPRRKTVLVRNYPILDEMQVEGAKAVTERRPWFAYIGTINQNRNIVRMVEAIGRVEHHNARLRLAGQFMNPDDRAQVEQLDGWDRVIYDEWLGRAEVARALAEVRAGLVVLNPVAHEMVSLPIKLFEYMAAGIPVIASDFPLWREIVEEAQCGILVNPEDVDAIAGAMNWIIANPREAQEMGENGLRAVTEKFSWKAESRNLTEFYGRKLGMGASGDS